MSDKNKVIKCLLNEVVNCGGITHKNPLFMQIYADIINKPMKIAASDETVALGAALMGAHVAYTVVGKDISYNQLQDRSCKMLNKVYLRRVYFGFGKNVIAHLMLHQ